MTDVGRRKLNKAVATWLGFDGNTIAFRQDGRVCCTDPNGCWQVYDFARDWNDMQVVVEQLRGLGWDVEIGTFAKTGRCLCNLYFFTDDVNADVPHEAADAATAPEAVALAALKVPSKKEDSHAIL